MGSSSSSTGADHPPSSPSCGIHHDDITSQQVATREHVYRPLRSSAGSLGIKHAGVRLTTDSGDQFLLEKSKADPCAGQTVVSSAKDMGNEWKSHGLQDAPDKTTVSDYIKAGGQNYGLLNDNCQHAAKRMMNVGN